MKERAGRNLACGSYIATRISHIWGHARSIVESSGNTRARRIDQGYECADVGYSAEAEGRKLDESGPHGKVAT